ncbi:MAG: ABC transporter permease [Promethearchaeota archaeon]
MGIILGIILFMVINIFTERYGTIVNNFFKPFDNNYSVVEKNSNFVQIMPFNSKINESIYQNMINNPEYANIKIIPVLFMQSTAFTNNSFNFNVIFGVPLEKMKDLFENWKLKVGKWPNSTDEVVLGNTFYYNGFNIGQNISLNNKTYRISGILENADCFINGFFIMDLEEMQDLFDEHGILSELYINKADIVKKGYNIEQFETEFEAAYSNLDLLNDHEIDQISNGILSNLDRVARVFLFLSLILSITFTISIIFLNTLDRQKEAATLRAIGISNKHLFLILYGEILLIVLLGLLIGLPLGILIYNAIYSFSVNKTEFTSISFWDSLLKVFKIPKLKSLSLNILIINLFSSLFISIIPYILLLKIKVQKELRVK